MNEQSEKDSHCKDCFEQFAKVRNHIDEGNFHGEQYKALQEKLCQKNLLCVVIIVWTFLDTPHWSAEVVWRKKRLLVTQQQLIADQYVIFNDGKQEYLKNCALLQWKPRQPVTIFVAASDIYSEIEGTELALFANYCWVINGQCAYWVKANRIK